MSKYKSKDEDSDDDFDFDDDEDDITESKPESSLSISGKKPVATSSFSAPGKKLDVDTIIKKLLSP